MVKLGCRVVFLIERQRRDASASAAENPRRPRIAAVLPTPRRRHKLMDETLRLWSIMICMRGPGTSLCRRPLLAAVNSI